MQIDDYKSYENLIAAREREATSFFKENVVEKSGMEAVLLKNDYHNAKVLIKAKYLRLSDVSDMILPDGLFDAEKMKADIFDDDYAAYPKYLAEALDAVDVAFANGNRVRATSTLPWTKRCLRICATESQKGRTIL